MGSGAPLHGWLGSEPSSPLPWNQTSSSRGAIAARCTVRTIRSHENVAVQSPWNRPEELFDMAVHGPVAKIAARNRHRSPTGVNVSDPAPRSTR